MTEQIIIYPQKGPQEQFINLSDDINIAFYGGKHCATFRSNASKETPLIAGKP